MAKKFVGFYGDVKDTDLAEWTEAKHREWLGFWKTRWWSYWANHDDPNSPYLNTRVVPHPKDPKRLLIFGVDTPQADIDKEIEKRGGGGRTTAKKIETIDYEGKLRERTAKYPPAVRYAIDRLRVGSENLLKGIGGIGVKNGDDNQTAQEKKKARKEAITEELVTSVDNVMKQKYPDTKKWSEDVNKLQWITMQVSAYYDRGVDPNRKVDRGSGDVIDNAAVQKTVYNMMNDVLSWYDNPNGMSPWGQKLGQVTEEFLKEKESVKGILREKGHVVKEQPAPTKTAAKVNPAVIGGVRQSR